MDWLWQTRRWSRGSTCASAASRRARDGQLLGAAFMYAAIAPRSAPTSTRLAPNWAGLAASELEKKHTDTVFLPIIGAVQMPTRNREPVTKLPASCNRNGIEY